MSEHRLNNRNNTQINGQENEETLLLMSEIHKTPNLTQRGISLKLNISLGKTNYLLRKLVEKGIVKIKNFSLRPDKLGKIRYYLTKKGIDEKLELTHYFFKKKEDEYNRLKKEWEELVLSKEKEL